MDTPICDFVRRYQASGALRLHMPGHKGVSYLGMEPLDITEFDGADSLYEADGIIARSEANASLLFGCRTYYSTEGSSQCIRAMLYLALLQAKAMSRAPVILAGRNAHKTLISAAALLDFQIDWLHCDDVDNYLSCSIDTKQLDEKLSESQILPAAVYVTSPDYLGRRDDIITIAKVCHRYDVPLLVDNAHGAYLKFLPNSLHPVDLGADMCCDSAHKTLPALTGAAYLHITGNRMEQVADQAKNALALFGSTSPSYLILQSLDALNLYLSTYSERLRHFLPKVNMLAESLVKNGYRLCGVEPLKLTFQAKAYGYTGQDLSALLMNKNIVSEFADPDYLVLMPTPELGDAGLARLERALLGIPMRYPIVSQPPLFHKPQPCLTVREALLSLSEELPINDCEGRILASANFGCPPAVPILVSGERIDRHAIACFRYYGIKKCRVVIE